VSRLRRRPRAEVRCYPGTRRLTRLLFDQNLSPRLSALLIDVFPDSLHVRDVGLAAADDVDVWRHAAAHDFVIVSKDADFHQLSFTRGAPPKAVWIRIGNCSTQRIERLLRRHARDVDEFAGGEAAFLALG
jgi:predicted nuclease of predicted toxin-antitoxin system